MLIARLRGWKIDQPCVRSLGRFLWGFMIIAVSLEVLEVLSIAYRQSEEWSVLGELIEQKLFFSYVVLQFFVFSLGPFLLLGINALFRLRDSISNTILWIASAMLLVQVLLMRWNVVIGGQLLSKSYRGFTSYVPGIFEKEGLITAAVIFTVPFVLLYAFHRFVPLFPAEAMCPRNAPPAGPARSEPAADTAAVKS